MRFLGPAMGGQLNARGTEGPIPDPTGMEPDAPLEGAQKAEGPPHARTVPVAGKFERKVFEALPLPASPDGDPPTGLELDYQETLKYWQQLVDVRFKLLALVPTLTAAGIGVFGESGSWESAALGAFGALVVTAILMYELRNSFFHDLAAHRLKELERQLGFRRTTWADNDDLDDPEERKDDWGGVFRDRFRPGLRLFGLTVQHDLALWIAYSASIAAWTSLLARGVWDELAVGDIRANGPMVYGFVGLVAFVTVMLALWLYDEDWSHLKNCGVPPRQGDEQTGPVAKHRIAMPIEVLRRWRRRRRQGKLDR